MTRHEGTIDWNERLAARAGSDEDCFVVDGDVTFDTLALRRGDYHVAHRGTPHPEAVSAGGCLLLVTAAAA